MKVRWLRPLLPELAGPATHGRPGGRNPVAGPVFQDCGNDHRWQEEAEGKPVEPREPRPGRRLSPTTLPAAGPGRPPWKALDLDMAKAKHRLLRRRHRLTPRRRCLVDMVDIRSLVMHLVTPDAAAAGLRGKGRYIALCGADVIPASLTEPGRFRCEPCLWQSVSVPSQRSRVAAS